MLARICVVRAAAARSYLATAGKQVKARAGRVLGDLGRQFAIKQRCRVAEAGRDGGEHSVPFVIGEPPDPDPDLIRLGLPSRTRARASPGASVKSPTAPERA